MASDDATRPRFPAVRGPGAHYESYYLKAVHPGGGLGVWVRHTVHKAPGAPPIGSLWCTVFDANRCGPLAVKATLAATDLAVTGEGHLRLGDAVFAPGLVEGGTDSAAAAATETAGPPVEEPDPAGNGPDVRPDQVAEQNPADRQPGQARWRLRHLPGEPPLWHLPRLWMYRSVLPRTKLLSITPRTRVSGRVDVDGEVVELDSWPGMVGHNWGAQHAERWIWVHCAGFDDRPDDWLDVALGRVRLGRWTTPWVANGVLSIDGRRMRLGGPQRVQATHVDENRLHCHAELPGDGVSVVIDVGAPAERFVGWQYADPEGGETHDTTNCSIADLALSVRGSQPDKRLFATGTATYELGGRDGFSGIPLQPFRDP